MTIIDRAVVEAAAGHRSVVDSAKASFKTLTRHPLAFFSNRSFGSMIALYLGTYITANVADTLCEHRDGTEAGTITSDTGKLGAIVGVNVCLSLYKDSVFARASAGVTASRFPARCYIPFLVRDTITLYATFCLPASLVSGGLSHELGADQHEAPSAMAETAALVLCPAASQFIATPLHVLGLDLYNRSTVSPRDRLRLVGKTWWPTSVVRACRVLPAFGLGSIVNTSVRQRLIDHT